MNINFPSNPNDGDELSADNITYRYDSSKNLWRTIGVTRTIKYQDYNRTLQNIENLSISNGDIFYYDGSNVASFSIGSESSALRGSPISWENKETFMLLDEIELANAASYYEISGLIDLNINALFIEFNIKPVTDNDELRIRLAPNTGIIITSDNYTTYARVQAVESDNTLYYTGDYTRNTTFDMNRSVIDVTAGTVYFSNKDYLSGRVVLMDLNRNDSKTHVVWFYVGTHTDNSNGIINDIGSFQFGGGGTVFTDRIDVVRVYMRFGNLDIGTKIKIIGVGVV